MGIRAISERDIHSITSGQVVIDLTTAVKELVENSLDASSSQISITFRNYGLDSIEVKDNGLGIKEEDFESVCLKNHTSKLETFEDVETVSTLGFRGEALSSLCAISEVSITTATKDMKPKAYKLEYSIMGNLNHKSIVSGKVGTLVLVSKLFKNLPVRRMELTKNSKREFQKVLTFLQAYAIISLGVRIMVTHIDSKGKKSTMLSSSGAKNLKSNILSVFGTNGMYGLEPIDMQISLNTRFKLKSCEMSVKVSGFVSNCSFGQGRSVSDRQLWFINSRPVHLQQFSKAVNEVYKSFNHLQFPVILINLEIDPLYVDINVTPDKRTVLINNESLVIEGLKEEFNNLFSSQDTRIPVNSAPIPRLNDRTSSFKQLKLGDDFQLKKSNFEEQEIESQEPKSQVFDNYNRIDETSSTEFSESEEDECDASEKEMEKSKEFEKEMEKVEEFEQVEDTEEFEMGNKELVEKVPERSLFDDDGIQDSNYDYKNDIQVVDISHSSQKLLDNVKPDKASENYNHEVQSEDNKLYTQIGNNDIIETDAVITRSRLSFPESHPSDCLCPNRSRSTSPVAVQTEVSPQTIKRKFYQDIQSTHNLEKTLVVSPAHLGTKRPRVNSTETHKTSLKDISDEGEAEKYLTLTVSKSDFLRMNVIGQFNLGFILVSKVDDGKTNLFIVDQHASDEKFNFEKYQRETIFESQPLVIPMSLDLNAIDELVIINNWEIFIKNGFKLKIEEENNPGDRIRLVSLPYSKDTIFDLSDFNELTHLVKETDGSSNFSGSNIVRPSKVRAMFAMRACRSSIMIGKALTYKTMEMVIRNLSTLDKPWNCPHGRPTMRHLMEVKDWASFSDDYRI